MAHLFQWLLICSWEVLLICREKNLANIFVRILINYYDNFWPIFYVERDRSKSLILHIAGVSKTLFPKAAAAAVIGGRTVRRHPKKRACRLSKQQLEVLHVVVDRWSSAF